MSVELEPGQKEILIEAQEYTELINSPGWKKILAFSENRAQEALAAIKNSASSDPMVRLRLQVIWSERELFMDSLHAEIMGKIELRKEVIEEVGISLGATREQIEQLVEQEEMYGR